MKEDHSQSNRSALSLAFWLNLLFSIVEVIGGILTNSTAIVADAIHDFMDAMAIGTAVWVEKISAKQRTHSFSYGYKRFSMLSALLMSVFLLFGAILMIYNAVLSFINPKEVHSIGMLWLAVLGIAVNGFAFLRIKGGGGHHHAHHHGHGHHHHQDHNHNTRAIMLHLLEDVLGWVAVLIGAVVIYFTNWYWIDGILAIAIALFIVYNATRNILSTMRVLLQSVPAHMDTEDLVRQISEVEGVKNVHDFHVWSLDGNYNVGSVHVVITHEKRGLENEILLAVLKVFENNQIHHPTVQIETDETACGLEFC